jgi:hypothetical protein
LGIFLNRRQPVAGGTSDQIPGNLRVDQPGLLIFRGKTFKQPPPPLSYRMKMYRFCPSAGIAGRFPAGLWRKNGKNI